jgi:hypothetical protein
LGVEREREREEGSRGVVGVVSETERRRKNSENIFSLFFPILFLDLLSRTTGFDNDEGCWCAFFEKQKRRNEETTK